MIAFPFLLLNLVKIGIEAYVLGLLWLNIQFWMILWNVQVGFTFIALIMVVYLVIDGIELVIDGFDEIVLDSIELGYEFVEQK